MSNESFPERRDIYAVLGAPDSRVPVQAPEDRKEARRMKGGNSFYCSTALGGCGGELTFAIGDVNVPHFRHQAGSRCSLISSKSQADRYTHLAMQEALRSWIETMPGFSCRLEVSIENGRTDVLVTGPSFEVALEVQRSALSARNALERTAVYGQRANVVQWLYASKDIEAYKTELADRGWSLRIWWGWAKKECRIGVSYETDNETDVEIKEIGGPLGDWEVTARGLASAHLRKAKEAVERRRAAERERQQQEAEDARLREEAKKAREVEVRKRRIEEQKASRAALLEALKHTPEGLENRWPSSWPQLRGSPSQVAWAESIRARAVALLREELVEEWLPEARGVPVALWLAIQSSASFWINCRFKDTLAIVQTYEHQFGSPGQSRR
ncbi:competence protein CoiA family protein [Pseudarthrobacter sp. H3Y2-7]|uniref:competence protein CoiA family protein n=1 Tax=Pseudarthrobacter naphthalenicus TaxID=3031328 RepID=UPI0023B0D140|nr:competence protein CoiA family protein [Pseudarthrobacter sp. H3Y2-7]MDE8670784.1 competence protein CoiA family protein [Pseudarthrobacter sp. H3Y2-7]